MSVDSSSDGGESRNVMTETMHVFGMKYYNAPRGEMARLGIKSDKYPKPKHPKKSFFYDLEKKTKLVPGPGMYLKHNDWNKMTRKGKLSNSKNYNVFDQTIKSSKKLPGPFNYKNDNWDKFSYKILGTGFKVTGPKSGHFDELSRMSQERVAPSKYDSVKLEMIKRRIKVCNFSN